MQPMADAAHVKLELVLIAPPEAMFFDGDSDRILQVLTNLLSNAVKFSPPHSLVEIRIEANADAVLLRVADQGRGIPVDKLDSIFDRFQQVEASDSRQKGGTGLGLAICRTIVQQHNGTIWAESNDFHQRPGASLFVSLPRTSRSQDPGNNRSLTMLSTPVHATVVVCDDDTGIRTVVGECLRRHAYNVLEAENGEHAIELATKNEVEAILLDLYMPGINGWQTLERLKKSPATSSIPVVILSVLAPSDTNGPVNGRSITAAAQGWVQKPFNEHLLLAELSRVLHSGDGPAHILLVEDDMDLAGFTDANVRVDHACTRQSAVDHCLVERPDLLILDLTLPDGDGFQLVDWLRRQPDLRSLPLVVYSGREVTDSEMTKLRLGHTQFLTKAKVQPHEVEELVLNIVHGVRSTAVASPS
jgi:DNA-binding response OmpR family regulator